MTSGAGCIPRGMPSMRPGPEAWPRMPLRPSPCRNRGPCAQPVRARRPRLRPKRVLRAVRQGGPGRRGQAAAVPLPLPPVSPGRERDRQQGRQHGPAGPAQAAQAPPLPHTTAPRSGRARHRGRSLFDMQSVLSSSLSSLSEDSELNRGIRLLLKHFATIPRVCAMEPEFPTNCQ